ncbi:Lrp/AsnC family transcriptional regulator [Ahrensia marina]|jgi:Lrp/AsnC family leucine-responsive transcriptional regulator|uniref:ArsR family transcriptional regulator n=1 Tax=Ahrensia marina TaxID=1514904 RepID=A0A0N0E8P7_9HYPH|nr:winged helix-turn-helix transcriptional regulator [Ahrensia marina]KPB02592.1 ArsR family transcriptional regulator [Ahrensia marina]
MKFSELDQIDRKILRILQSDGRISVTQLSEKVGLSKTPCQMRIKKLQDEGYIAGYRAVLDPTKMGLGHVTFIEVKMNDTTPKALKAFNDAIRKIPEIEMCHLIAGGFDYLLKVRTTNIVSYREILGEVISSLPYVSSTSTHVSMEAVKDDL